VNARFLACQRSVKSCSRSARQRTRGPANEGVLARVTPTGSQISFSGGRGGQLGRENLAVESGSNARRGLDPELRPGRFVFASVPTIPNGIAPLATVVEPEGVSVVLSADQAERLGLRYEFVAGMITLRVDSALDAAGLTAAVATALAEAGLACNVVAGHHHDHLFVPHERAEEAMSILRALAIPSSS
jgi:uncharacterized protein